MGPRQRHTATVDNFTRDEAFVIAWRMIDELLLRLLRGDTNAAAAESIWQQLRLDFPGHTAAILCDMHHDTCRCRPTMIPTATN